jgi:hypothetical protein
MEPFHEMPLPFLDFEVWARDLEFKSAGVYITGWAKTQNGNSGLRPFQSLNRMGGTKREH